MQRNTPYRDDEHRRLVETARLRSLALQKQRARRAVLVVGALCAHVGLRLMLQPQLNGASDAGFWLAALVVAIPLLFLVAAPLAWLFERSPKDTHR